MEHGLQRRRVIRGVIAGLLVALCGAIAIDQVTHSNDWRRFDQKTVTVVGIPAGDQIVIDGRTTIRLIGVDAPYKQSLDYTRARLASRQVLLRLEPTQTRDDAGRLMAYVYLGDNDCLNLALIRDGKAFADRRHRHTFSPQYEQAENEARKKGRGMWKDLREDQQPQWRREWLEQLRKERSRGVGVP